MNRDEALKKLQATELEILLILRDFCAEHDVSWFLDGGTLLGAVRHGGFIPWDDDVDVGMLRKDYDRFVALAKQDLPDGFSYHDASNTPGYAAMFGKIYKDGTQFLTDETLEAGHLRGHLPLRSSCRKPRAAQKAIAQCQNMAIHGLSLPRENHRRPPSRRTWLLREGRMPHRPPSRACSLLPRSHRGTLREIDSF